MTRVILFALLVFVSCVTEDVDEPYVGSIQIEDSLRHYMDDFIQQADAHGFDFAPRYDIVVVVEDLGEEANGRLVRSKDGMTHWVKLDPSLWEWNQNTHQMVEAVFWHEMGHSIGRGHSECNLYSGSLSPPCSFMKKGFWWANLPAHRYEELKPGWVEEIFNEE